MSEKIKKGASAKRGPYKKKPLVSKGGAPCEPKKFNAIVTEIQKSRENQKPNLSTPNKTHAIDAASPSDTTTNKSTSGSPSDTPSSAATPGANAGTGAAPMMLSSGIPKEALRNTLQIPFAIAAVKTKYPGLALGHEEAQDLVPLFDHCIAQYLPALMTEHAVAYMLGFSLLMTVGAKYLGYEKHRQAQSPAGGAVPPARDPQSHAQPTAPLNSGTSSPAQP